MSRLVTIGEAARELGVSPKTLRRYEARGLIKSIRTMGGQRRYYLSTLEGILASAEDDDDENEAVDTAKPQVDTPALSRKAAAWDAVDEERAALEALKIRSQREALVAARDRERERIQQESITDAERLRREATLREQEERQTAARTNEEKEHAKNINLQLAVAEVFIAQEPHDAHSHLRRALAGLLTPTRIPTGTPVHRIQQLVRDEIASVAAPFRRVHDQRKRGNDYAERRLATYELSYSDRRRIRDLVDDELCTQTAKDWSARNVQALVDSVIEEFFALEDDEID